MVIHNFENGMRERINWFPGHMAKAMREAANMISRVDMVLEIRDARLPLTSGNPAMEKHLKQKPRLVLLNKANLADKANMKLWLDWFIERNEPPVLFINALKETSIKAILKKARSLMADKWKRYQRKKIHHPPLRMMLLGIPNTGKSTIINRLARRKAANTGDRPGITRSQEWIVLGRDLELLDTPGIMPPRIETEEQGMWLCAIHAIKDDIVSPEKLALFLVNKLLKDPPLEFRERYRLENEESAEAHGTILKIGELLHFRKKGGEIDFGKTCNQIMLDFRKGRLGAYSFERPPT